MRTFSFTLLATAAAYAVITGDLAAASSWNVTSVSAPTRRLASEALLSCSLQADLDFVGNDLANVPAAASSDCCAKCSAQSGCNAFTWTNYNGGTCWFKSAKGLTVAKPGAQSGLAATSSPLPGTTSCSIETGVDYPNNDIGNVPAAAATDCCAKCSAHAGCGAFTWTAYNGGTCWLKSGKGATIAKADAFSSVLGTRNDGPAPSSGVCSPVEENIDYSGVDIGNAPARSASECCTKCSGHQGCGAFTWTNYNGGTCWLKSSKGNGKVVLGAVSAVVTASATGGTGPTPSVTQPATQGGACSAVEENVDYTGSDIGNFPSSGAADCCTKCSQRSGCGAFTWTNYNGGTCWLKSAKGVANTMLGAVSAVVATSTTPTTGTGTGTGTPTTSTGRTNIQPRLRAREIPLRSVNLGGWLVAENWMSLNSPAWTDAGDAAGQGEYVTMQKLGKEKGTRQFEQHRATWITENDIAQIAAAGLNAVRVPVGFWIVNDDPSTVATDISRVYAAGALKYLDKLINEWAVTYNLAVMISLHAHQGSQNGYDHSSPQVFGAITWSNAQANVDSSLQFATFLAARYKDSVAFLGMNLMNEPMFPTNLDVVQAYYKEAYKRIRSTGNNCVLVMSPPLWNQTPPTMMDFMHAAPYVNVWHEFHVYFRWTLEGKNEYQILDIAKPYRQMNIDPWTGNPLHLGEWSLAGPDSAPFQDKDLLRQYAAIQMTNYAAAPAGWAFWSWRHDEETIKISGWSLRQLLREGIITIPRVN